MEPQVQRDLLGPWAGMVQPGLLDLLVSLVSMGQPAPPDLLGPRARLGRVTAGRVESAEESHGGQSIRERPVHVEPSWGNLGADGYQDTLAIECLTRPNTPRGQAARTRRSHGGSSR